jgi:hypothetical protein
MSIFSLEWKGEAAIPLLKLWSRNFSKFS